MKQVLAFQKSCELLEPVHLQLFEALRINVRAIIVYHLKRASIAYRSIFLCGWI